MLLLAECPRSAEWRVPFPCDIAMLGVCRRRAYIARETFWRSAGDCKDFLLESSAGIPIAGDCKVLFAPWGIYVSLYDQEPRRTLDVLIY